MREEGGLSGREEGISSEGRRGTFRKGRGDPVREEGGLSGREEGIR